MECGNFYRKITKLIFSTNYWKCFHFRRVISVSKIMLNLFIWVCWKACESILLLMQ